MSFITIIYSSLLVFSVVMTVILVVSYLSFRARRRNAPIENSIHEHSNYHNPSIVVSRPAYAAPKPVPVPVYTNLARTYHQEPRKSSVAVQQTARQTQRRETSDFSSRKRFQVMNNTRSEYISQFQSSSIGGFGTVPAPEFNFLNYYSDHKEDKLNQIQVNGYKNYR